MAILTWLIGLIGIGGLGGGVWYLTRSLKWSVLAILATLSAFLAFQVWQGHGREKALSEALSAEKAKVEQLENTAKSNDKAAEVRIIYRDRILASEAKGKAKTDEALRNNQEWANTPVPADVLSSLSDDQ